MATSIPTITETIAPYSVTPAINTATFPEDIDVYNSEQPSRITSKNIVNAQINATTIAITTVAGEVQDSADASEGFANDSEGYSLVAQSATNYQGDWEAGFETVGYALADNVTYTDGKNYISKITDNLIEPTIGTETNEWNFIDAVTNADLSLKEDITDNNIKQALDVKFGDLSGDGVITGLTIAVSANLNSTIIAGIVYVVSSRIETVSTPHLFTASIDTYVDIQADGIFIYSEVATGTSAPSIIGTNQRLAKVETDVDNITAVIDLRTIVELELALKANKAETYTKDEVDVDVTSLANSTILMNGLLRKGALELPTVEVIGSTPILYVGNGTSLSIATPMQIANDNGDGTTLAPDWTNITFAVGSIVIDQSAATATTRGDALAYRCIVEVILAEGVSPRYDVDTNGANADWVLENNQYGGRYWFKGRTNAHDNKVFDSIRRELKNIETNTTAIEASLANSLTAIGVNSLTVGSDVTVNTNTEDYVLWVAQTIRKTAGYRTDAGVMQNSKNNVSTDLMVKDSAGNPIIEHYNPITKTAIILDVGNGIAGRTIPHSLQSKPSFFVKKNLDISRNWACYNKVSGAGKTLLLNDTSAEIVSSVRWNNMEPTETNFTVGTDIETNTDGNQYITYMQADSDNHVVKEYNGSGTIGNVVDFDLDMTIPGSYAMIKKLSGTGSWVTYDILRGGGRLEADASSAEITDSLLIEFTSTGIIIQSTSSELNTLGGEYLIQAYIPKYNQPTGGSLIDVNADIDLTYIQGISNTNKQEATAAHSVDLSAFAGDKAYLLKEFGSNVIGAVQNLNVGQSRIDADRWGTINGDYRTTDIHGGYESATGFVNSSTTESSGDFEAWEAFNKGTIVGSFQGWLTSVGNTIGWIQYTLSKPRKLKNYKINSGALGGVSRAPNTFTLEGSNDGLTWATLDSQSGIVFTAENEWSSAFTIAAPLLFKYVRLDITTNNGDVNYVGLGELELNFEISDAPYINTLDKIVYDSSDIATNLIAIGECKVDTQGNNFDLVEYEPLESYFNSATFTGAVDLSANVKIVDFGNIFIDQRISMDNPLGNETASGCIARLELFYNGDWIELHAGKEDDTGFMTGAEVTLSSREGLVVQTSLSYILSTQSSRRGSAENALVNITKGLCRVIVVKISRGALNA